MFKLTPAAAEQILQAADIQDDAPTLRVAAKIDEDGEIAYGMGFDEERENDQVLECHGVQVLIAPRSQELLADTTLDFVEHQPGEFQFIFLPGGGDAPSACGGCAKRGGCGS